MQRASLLAASARAARGGSRPAASQAAAAAEATPPLDKDAIEQALARASGVVAQAAAELGLSRQALYRRMERFGISRNPARMP